MIKTLHFEINENKIKAIYWNYYSVAEILLIMNRNNKFYQKMFLHKTVSS